MEVRPVERGRDDLGVLDAELEQDVGADVRRRGRGGREHRRPADVLERLAQRQVRGPEVVAPLRHAVGLVDDEPRHADPTARVAQVDAELRIRHPLRRREQQLAAGRAHERVDLAALPHGERRVDLRRAHALGDHLVELVLDQRDQRADDDGDAGDDERRELVQQRLAAAGRHDREDVLVVEQIAERLGLARAERADAEGFLPHAEQRTHVGGQPGALRRHRTVERPRRARRGVVLRCRRRCRRRLARALHRRLGRGATLRRRRSRRFCFLGLIGLLLGRSSSWTLGRGQTHVSFEGRAPHRRQRTRSRSRP